MRTGYRLVAALAIVCTTMHPAAGEVAVAIDRNGADATAEFKFETAPQPSQRDAGNEATFTIITGRRDGNGGDASTLNDGLLPQDADDPSANFFFAAGTPGGRVLVDLGEAKSLQRIATYSWHPEARGPQVYKIYGDASQGGEFDAAAASKGEQLDEKAWTLIAEVDARKVEDAGGQYGVNISSPEGKPLASYRYLLFDISRTGGHDLFDNTFFSEIDLDDGKAYAPAKDSQPPVVIDVLKIGADYEIAFDTTQAPELREWVVGTLMPICETWYPKIVEMLPSDNYRAPRRFVVVFEKDMRGVAYTSGPRVVCAAPWFNANLDGEAAGAVVHELVHVVQQYGRTRTGNRSPGWMVEGLADYIRWFMYEPEQARPRPNPDRAHYTDSYRTTGAFLDFVVQRHDKDCIRKFNAAMRSGQYSEELWKQYTGKSVDELWKEYLETLR